MKICSKCKIKKPLSDFYKKSDRKNGASFCKKCFNSYCIQRWINVKKKAIEYKGGKCLDCGNTFPYYVYDFHHVNPIEKDNNFGNIKTRSWKIIVKELDKCVLLCANCHRQREHEMVGELGIEPRTQN